MHTLNLVEIGEKLLSVRRKKGMTQGEVAEKAGLSDRAYADIERGTANMRVETALKICKALNVTPNDILIDEEIPMQSGTDLLVKLNSCSENERKTAIKLINVFMNYINNRKEVNVFDSLNMGFFAEGLFGFFTLGFGGGIKVPLGGSLRYDNIIELLNYGRLKNRFDDLYIPYIKFIIGLRYDSAYAGGGSSLSFYFNYDFPKIKVKGVEPDIQRLCSIDLGVQIGFHFGYYEYID